MTWSVNYWDDGQCVWRTGLTTEHREPAVQVADWLNEIGWRARVEKDLNDASGERSQPAPDIRRRDVVENRPKARNRGVALMPAERLPVADCARIST